MLRNRYLISLIVFLFILVVIYNINFFLKRRQPPHLKLASTVTAPERGTTAEGGKSPFPVIKDKSRWRRDPFIYSETESRQGRKPVGDKKDANVKIVLQGIMKTKGKFYALVNGDVVKKGDRIEGMLVEDIFKDGILLRDRDKQKKIRLE